MLKTSCRCGAVRVEVARRPASITECNCSICRRYGARWAYYSRRSTRLVAAEDALERYAPAQDLHFVRCRTCGCVVMWEPVHSRGDVDRVGINLRLVDDPGAIAGVKVQRFDGARTWRTIKQCVLEEPGW